MTAAKNDLFRIQSTRVFWVARAIRPLVASRPFVPSSRRPGPPIAVPIHRSKLWRRPGESSPREIENENVPDIPRHSFGYEPFFDYGYIMLYIYTYTVIHISNCNWKTGSTISRLLNKKTSSGWWMFHGTAWGYMDFPHNIINIYIILFKKKLHMMFGSV